MRLQRRHSRIAEAMSEVSPRLLWLELLGLLDLGHLGHASALRLHCRRQEAVDTTTCLLWHAKLLLLLHWVVSALKSCRLHLNRRECRLPIRIGEGALHLLWPAHVHSHDHHAGGLRLHELVLRPGTKALLWLHTGLERHHHTRLPCWLRLESLHTAHRLLRLHLLHLLGILLLEPSLVDFVQALAWWSDVSCHLGLKRWRRESAWLSRLWC